MVPRAGGTFEPIATIKAEIFGGAQPGILGNVRR
jgi:hypothetical protein